MASPSVHKHVSDNNQLCDEPTKFPYLLTLDDDTKLLENEPLEMMALEEESEKSSPNPMATHMMSTTERTAKILQANPTPNLATNTPTTVSSTATTPAVITINGETAYPTKETLSTMLTQLAIAQEEITSLRHRAEQSDMRIFEYEQRLINMENTLTQLMQLCPILQETFRGVCDSITLMTQPSDPTEEDVGAKVLYNKRKWEGNSNNNLGHQLTIKPKVVKINAIGPEEKKGYEGHRPYCPSCNHHHKEHCGAPCGKCKRYGHQTKDCKAKTCFECGKAGHIRNECPKLSNNTRQNP